MAPYGKPKFLDSGGSIVARPKLKGIDGRAPPGVEPVAQFDSTRENFGRDWESIGRVLGKFGRVLESLGDFGRLWESFDGRGPPGVEHVAQFDSTLENFGRD